MALGGLYTMINAQILQRQDRRAKPRIACSFPACVHVRNHSGIKYEAQAVLKNMSASGVYLRMKRKTELNETLYIFVKISARHYNQNRGPKIAVQGKVVRIDPIPDGEFGIAVRLDNFWFL